MSDREYHRHTGHSHRPAQNPAEKSSAPAKLLTRDQERALYAYNCVGNVPEKDRKEYKIVVNQFGANVMRSGLAVALTFLERRQDRKADKLFLSYLANGPGTAMDQGEDPSRLPVHKLFLSHLANGPGTAMNQGEDPSRFLVQQVCDLGLDRYMVITREYLQLAAWFRRAVQAICTDEKAGANLNNGEEG